ncbi:energy transducer TonB [Massilia niabensis]|uniref:Energy transducer TonB n=1 Tax=Massilia niabensis TaxID=544910 RepID=A0ABW0L579_9BURK
MSHIKQFIYPAQQALKWKAAILALGLAVASLAGCAQAPAAQGDTVTRGSSAVAGADKTTSALKTSTCARPEYPKDARRRGSQGTTTIRFLIDTDGSVAQSDIVKSSGDASLDEAARSALAKCRFKTAKKDGKPRRAWVPVQYVWTMEPASQARVPPATPAAPF